MIAAENICLELGNQSILQEIHCRIESGKILGLLGPNGAGKSSLLRILSGTWKPSGGRVTLNGVPLDSLDPRKLAQQRAVLSQSMELNFSFTALEVVLMGRAPHIGKGSESPEDYRIAREALGKVDLHHRSEVPFTNLSGGEQQRVHLARCIAQLSIAEGTPPIPHKTLFLDEPTSKLDLEHQFALFRIIRGLAQSGVGICVVLHDLNQALTHADEWLVLHEGKIALSGEPRQIVRNPRMESVFKVRIQPDCEVNHLEFSPLTQP